MFKRKRWRNRKYLDWVKAQDCMSCMAPADDPHHIIGVGLSGTGLTAPDWSAVPLCRRCHTNLHDKGTGMDMQWEWVARTLGKALEEGVIK